MSVKIPAQSIWLPRAISFQGIKFEEYFYEKREGSGIKDSVIRTGTQPQDWNLIGYPQYNNVVNQGDSVFATGQLMAAFSLGALGDFTITFLLDTSESTVRNFTIRYSYSRTYIGSSCGAPSGGTTIESEKDFIRFTNLSYKNLGDTELYISSYGDSAFKQISDFFYDDYSTSSYYWRGDNCQSWNNYHSLNLIPDSTEYACSIIFSKKQKNLVSTRKRSTLILTINILSNSIHYAFPNCVYTQTLIIYDILGREVKRIEIPSGASEYRLQRDGFMSGYYFARLGNLGAKFVVW